MQENDDFCISSEDNSWPEDEIVIYRRIVACVRRDGGLRRGAGISGQFSPKRGRKSLLFSDGQMI